MSRRKSAHVKKSKSKPLAREQEEALRYQNEQNRRELAQKQASVEDRAQQRELDPVYDTIGGRNASMDRTALGDQDSQSERFPNYHADPMLSRAPRNEENAPATSTSEVESESPWRNAIRGTPQDNDRQTDSSETEEKSTPDQQ